MKNSTVDAINKRLKIYGSNDYGEPKFRVVFTDDEVESRKGTFNDVTPSGIFIRTVSEIREVPKYPWLKSRWILERWASGSFAYHPDLITMKNGVYICVYIFQDKEKNYLPPLWKVTEIVVKHLLHPPKASEIKSRDEESEEKLKEVEVNEIQEKLAIESEESKIKDPKSSKELMSVGYTKEKI